MFYNASEVMHSSEIIAEIPNTFITQLKWV